MSEIQPLGQTIDALKGHVQAASAGELNHTVLFTDIAQAEPFADHPRFKPVLHRMGKALRGDIEGYVDRILQIRPWSIPSDPDMEKAGHLMIRNHIKGLRMLGLVESSPKIQEAVIKFGLALPKEAPGDEDLDDLPPPPTLSQTPPPLFPPPAPLREETEVSVEQDKKETLGEVIKRQIAESRGAEETTVEATPEMVEAFLDGITLEEGVTFQDPVVTLFDKTDAQEAWGGIYGLVPISDQRYQIGVRIHNTSPESARFVSTGMNPSTEPGRLAQSLPGEISMNLMQASGPNWDPGRFYIKDGKIMIVFRRKPQQASSSAEEQSNEPTDFTNGQPLTEAQKRVIAANRGVLEGYLSSIDQMKNRLGLGGRIDEINQTYQANREKIDQEEKERLERSSKEDQEYGQIKEESDKVLAQQDEKIRGLERSDPNREKTVTPLDISSLERVPRPPVTEKQPPRRPPPPPGPITEQQLARLGLTPDGQPAPVAEATPAPVEEPKVEEVKPKSSNS